MATGAPFVSEGIASRRTHRRILVMAVPTTDPEGHVTGVLTGALFVDGFRVQSGSSDLGFTGLVVLDRRGRELLAGFARPRNAALQRRLLKDQIGLLSGVRGLDEGSDHLVVFATAQIPGWTIAIDRPRPDVFAAARNGLVLALALLAAAAAAVFGLVGWLLLRARREAEERSRLARQRGELSHTFSGASLAAEVARGLVTGLTTAFPTARSIVALEGEGGTLQLSAARGDGCTSECHRAGSRGRGGLRACVRVGRPVRARERATPARGAARGARQPRRGVSLALLRPAPGRRSAPARRALPALRRRASARPGRAGTGRVVRRGGGAGARPGAQLRARARGRRELAARSALGGAACDRGRRSARPLRGRQCRARGGRRLVRRRPPQRRHRADIGRRRCGSRARGCRPDGADAQRVPCLRLRPQLARRSAEAHATARHG